MLLVDYIQRGMSLLRGAGVINSSGGSDGDVIRQLCVSGNLSQNVQKLVCQSARVNSILNQLINSMQSNLSPFDLSGRNLFQLDEWTRFFKYFFESINFFDNN